MDASYPRNARLRRTNDIRRVVGKGEVYPGRQALVRRIRNDAGRARLGLAAPTRYGNAVRRNRFRRLAREAFRRIQAELGAWDYMLSPRKGLAEPTLEGLQADLLRTLTARPAPPRPRRR